MLVANAPYRQLASWSSWACPPGTVEELRQTVEQVDADPTIRANLAAMKRALDDAGGASAGADAIEHQHRLARCR